MFAKKLLGLVLAAVATISCDAADEDAPPAPVDESSEDFSLLQSAPLAESDMKAIATPAGMPKPYEQPDSTGLFDERGKCGPTAVANTLLLYWISVTPQQADAAGVHWLIGTMGTQIETYMQEFHPELGCSLEHPENGPGFLRAEIDSGHPVMVWFNMPDADSHWVVAVGHTGAGAAEQVIVMSWGRYYAIPMSKLAAAWKMVYGIRNPAVVCADRTTLLR